MTIILSTRSILQSRVPWLNIVTCVPMYAIAVNHICSNFIFYILLTSLPTYFSTILRFNLQENGIMFSIPYIFNLIFTIISGQIADRIRANRILSTTATRRWQTIIGSNFRWISSEDVHFFCRCGGHIDLSRSSGLRRL